MDGPLVRWAGGKRRVLHQLVRHLPKDYRERRHVEPFAGGAALYWSQFPATALLNDANQELISYYRYLAEGSARLDCTLEALRALYQAQPMALYRKIRDVYNNKSGRCTGPERAAYFKFLNATCFNGLYRVNRKGEFNVPWGRIKKPRLGVSGRARAKLADTCLTAKDYRELTIRPSDLVYVDPPYDGTFQTYTTALAWDANRCHVELRDWLMGLPEGAAWMLSTSDTPLIRELYTGRAVIYRFEATQAIAATVKGRVPRAELVVRNYV